MIEKYKEKDERILLIKNKSNKGTLITRNIGSIYSKGKYLIFPDPDDIISKNIIIYSYNYAKKYDYDIIRFLMIKNNGKLVFQKFVKNIKKNIVYQPELSTYIFYGNNELELVDCFLTNKIIKKEVYIKSLNLLNNYYLNSYMIFLEDSLINFMIYRIANSLYIINKIGYYYRKNTQSITNNLKNIPLTRIKSLFLYLKLVLEFSKNTKYEKDYFNLRISLSYNIFISLLYFRKMNFSKIYFYQAINMFKNNNKFIDKNIINFFNNLFQKDWKYGKSLKSKLKKMY